VSYDVVRSDSAGWEERPGHEGQQPRHAADVTTAANLASSRARLWRYPPRTRGRRHRDLGQEEVFVCLRGTLTMLLGEPPERVDLEPGELVAVHTGTPMQARNESDEEVLFFAYGAPPVTGKAEFLADVESV
jgi:mannose-6-phosphate isomerase-like protein (cupin superfamily)